MKDDGEELSNFLCWNIRVERSCMRTWTAKEKEQRFQSLARKWAATDQELGDQVLRLHFALHCCTSFDQWHFWRAHSPRRQRRSRSCDAYKSISAKQSPSENRYVFFARATSHSCCSPSRTMNTPLGPFFTQHQFLRSPQNMNVFSLIPGVSAVDFSSVRRWPVLNNYEETLSKTVISSPRIQNRSLPELYYSMFLAQHILIDWHFVFQFCLLFS